jgi:DNA-binding NtrC family response regulator
VNVSNRISVLVAEDEYFIAREIAEALEEKGAKVIGPVRNLTEVEALLQKPVFDFAVLDINLNGEFIYKVADEMMARHIPFIFATGYAADAIPERFQHIERWEKPFDVEALVTTLPDTPPDDTDQR